MIFKKRKRMITQICKNITCF